MHAVEQCFADGLVDLIEQMRDGKLKLVTVITTSNEGIVESKIWAPGSADSLTVESGFERQVLGLAHQVLKGTEIEEPFIDLLMQYARRIEAGVHVGSA